MMSQSVRARSRLSSEQSRERKEERISTILFNRKKEREGESLSHRAKKSTRIPFWISKDLSRDAATRRITACIRGHVTHGEDVTQPDAEQ